MNNGAGKIMLSFCIPVYNQPDMVRRCISEILLYPGDDIEVVVNDDCSTEDIAQLVRDFGDERVRYYRNETNLGHDLNIIRSFRNARSNFAFLLRVRDGIIADAIPDIIDRIKKNPSLAYLTGNALDELGNLRLSYDRELYACGHDALEKHKNLYFHPSGSLYRIDMLDLDREERFIKEQFDTKFGFLVHHMMRLELAVKGDFELVCHKPIWCYTDTLRATDVAVNSDKKKISVFAPVYMEQRFIGEMKWAAIALPDEYKQGVYKWLIAKYLNLNTWGFKRRNEEKSYQRHYGYDKMDFSISQERRHFAELARKSIDDVCADRAAGDELKKYLNACVLKNKTVAPVRFYTAQILRGTFVYGIHKKRNVKKGIT